MRKLFGMLRRSLIAILLLAAPINLLAQQPQVQNQFLADFHKTEGLACISCHKEDPPKSPALDTTCIACHGGLPVIVARTDNYYPNPHVSPHSTDLKCTTCHHGHKAQEISCTACHAGKTFVKQYDKPQAAPNPPKPQGIPPNN